MKRDLLALGLQEFVADFAHLQGDEQLVLADSKHCLSVKQTNSTYKTTGVMPYAKSISCLYFYGCKSISHI